MNPLATGQELCWSVGRPKTHIFLFMALLKLPDRDDGCQGVDNVLDNHEGMSKWIEGVKFLRFW